MSTRPTLALIAAIATAGLLAGCAPPSPASLPVGAATSGGSPTSAIPQVTPSTAPVATPTAAPPTTATMDANVLFIIRATVTATGSTGAKLDLVETVDKPTTTATPNDTAKLNLECAGWKSQYPTRQFITTDIVSTLEAGSPQWSKKAAWLGVDLGLVPAWSGSYATFEAYCAGGILKTVPGRVHGILPIPGSNPADATRGWAKSVYGFFAAVDGAIPAAQRIKYTNCSIELSATAAANATAAGWPGHPHTSGGLACTFGKQTV